jgi:hypothetical protein
MKSLPFGRLFCFKFATIAVENRYIPVDLPQIEQYSILGENYACQKDHPAR